MTQIEVAKKLNLSVANVLTNKQINGFEKAFLVSSAIQELQALLTPEYMKPIMAMQGNRLGFKTDKDKESGYPEHVVKNCLIEAVLMGLQPTGNQFNIIAGNTYATKEGVGELLKSIPGLSYKINFELPRINNDKSSAAIKALVKWEIDGKKDSDTVEIPVKMNSAMGTDAVIGKATRKARKWLFDTLTGSELPEGDVEDAKFTYVNEKEPVDKENERLALLINDADSPESLQILQPYVKPELLDLFNSKMDELKSVPA
jgi:hypothetical protein